MSAHIAIRCDECKTATLFARAMEYEELVDHIIELARRGREAGWEIANADICPFCATRRKAKEQAEAKPK